MVAVVELDPWGGETDRCVNQWPQPYRYTTYERDGNGVDQALMRSYQGWHSRFDQPDPWDGSYDLTDPQSFNRYAYVRNDPVNFADPTGMLTVGPVNGGQLRVVTVRADVGPDWTALWELWMFGMQIGQLLLQPIVGSGSTQEIETIAPSFNEKDLQTVAAAIERAKQLVNKRRCYEALRDMGLPIFVGLSTICASGENRICWMQAKGLTFLTGDEPLILGRKMKILGRSSASLIF